MWAEGALNTKDHQRPSAQYSDSVQSQQSVYKWINMFKYGWTSVTNKQWSGCLSTTTKWNNEEVHATSIQQEGDCQWSVKLTAD
jgi:hypothetical protein